MLLTSCMDNAQLDPSKKNLVMDKIKNMPAEIFNRVTLQMVQKTLENPSQVYYFAVADAQVLIKSSWLGGGAQHFCVLELWFTVLLKHATPNNENGDRTIFAYHLQKTGSHACR